MALDLKVARLCMFKQIFNSFLTKRRVIKILAQSKKVNTGWPTNFYESMFGSSEAITINDVGSLGYKYIFIFSSVSC